MKYEYNTISNSEYLGDRFLNKLGEVGWELVSHTYIPDRHTHYYTFKREKVSTQDPAIEINPNPKGIDVWKELYERYKLTEEYVKDKEYRDMIHKGNKQYFNSNIPLK